MIPGDSRSMIYAILTSRLDPSGAAGRGICNRSIQKNIERSMLFRASTLCVSHFS